MDMRNVGRSGLLTSLVGLGCNNFGMKIDAQASKAVVHAALDEGITLFDTADVYSRGASEEMLGEALKGHRDEVVIATKFAGKVGSSPYQQGPSRLHIMQACEASLRRLGTDHIDLYYLHYPHAGAPMDETLDALDDLVRQGKVRYLGSSNLAGWQVIDADHIARSRHSSPFVASQVEWNLLERGVEAEHVPACDHVGVGVIPYYPLASGVLTGKYRRDAELPAGSRVAELPYFADMASDDRLAKVEALIPFAEERGHTLLELAMSWVASQPSVASVLAGASSPEQVVANVAAVSWTLTPEDLTALDELRTAT